MRTKLRLLQLLLFFPLLGFAQNSGSSFSLQQAIDYALANSYSVKNAQLDVNSSIAKVGQTRADGLPQISGSATVLDYVIVPTSFLPAQFLDANAPAGTFAPVKFQTQYSGSATINGSQLLFNGSYFVGLKAAKTYKQLYSKNLTATKINTVENVTKAYYSVLVNEERLSLLKVNVSRLDSLLFQTKAQYKNGFVEAIDVDRIEVQYNNLLSDAENTTKSVELSYNSLKFQMSIPVSENINLTDKLSDLTELYFATKTNQINSYDSRIEYSQLQTQKELNILDIKNNRAGYLPSLSFVAGFGYTSNRAVSKDVINAPWYQTANIGLSLNVPIFDGLTKYYKIQQARISLQKTENSIKQLKQSIDLDVKQADITLENSLAKLKTQKRNLDLAEKVAKVSQIKYKQGVGSNIEVINAEASFKEAQTNYYAALYDALVAKTDLDISTGSLYGGTNNAGIK